MAVKRLLSATTLFTMSTFGNKFCWKHKGIHIHGWAFQVKVCAQPNVIQWSHNFWTGACNEWQKIAWKVQLKNNCKGNYWCGKKILWNCPALNWKQLINCKIILYESLSYYTTFGISNVCMMANGFFQWLLLVYLEVKWEVQTEGMLAASNFLIKSQDTGWN